MIEIKKVEYNDVPFVPCNDCSHWDDCQEQAYKEGYQQGRADASGQEMGITSDQQFITYKGRLYKLFQDKINTEFQGKIKEKKE